MVKNLDKGTAKDMTVEQFEFLFLAHSEGNVLGLQVGMN